MSDRYIYQEEWDDISNWNFNRPSQVIHSNDLPDSGNETFKYIQFKAEPHSHRGTVKLSPFDSGSNGPGTLYDNIKISLKLRINNSHPLMNGQGSSPPGNAVMRWTTLDSNDTSEQDFSNKKKVNWRWAWKPSVAKKFEFRGGGAAPDGTPYSNTRYTISASGAAVPDQWTDLEIILRLNPNSDLGAGGLFKVDMISPYVDDVLLVQNERTDRYGTGIRIMELGLMEDDVGPGSADGNLIEVGPITIENLDSPKVLIELPPSGLVHREVYMSASGTTVPTDENGPVDVGLLTYTWDFGDGITITDDDLHAISHIYSASGTYWINLTAEYNGLSDSSSGALNIYEPLSVPEGYVFPVMNSPFKDEAGATIIFDSSGTLSSSQVHELYYIWDFGDSITAEGVGLSGTTHAYAAGSYTVSLYIEDDLVEPPDFSGVITGTAAIYTITPPPIPTAPATHALIARTIQTHDADMGASGIIENIPSDIYTYGHFGSRENVIQDLQDAGYTIIRYMNLLTLKPWAIEWSQISYPHFFWTYCNGRNLFLRDKDGYVIHYRWFNIPGNDDPTSPWYGKWQHIIDWGKTTHAMREELAIGPITTDGLGFVDQLKGPILSDVVFPYAREWMFLSGVSAGGHLSNNDIDYDINLFASGIIDMVKILASGTSDDVLYQDRDVVANGWWGEGYGWDLGYTDSEGAVHKFLNLFENTDGSHSSHSDEAIVRWAAQSGSILGLDSVAGPDHPIVQQATQQWLSTGGIILAGTEAIANYLIDQRDQSAVSVITVDPGVGATGFIHEDLEFYAGNTTPPSGIGVNELYFRWDFGDGYEDSGVGLSGVSHVYSASGYYIVEVSAQYGPLFGSGLTFASVDERIIAEAGPVQSGIVGVPMQFSAIGTTGPLPLEYLYYYWDYGDSSPIASGTNLITPLHTYTVSGVYDVLLTVYSDDFQLSAEDTTMSYIEGGLSGSANGPYEALLNVPIELSGSASFLPSDGITFQWFWYSIFQSVQTNIGSTQVINANFTKAGTHDLFLEVSAIRQGQILDTDTFDTTVSVISASGVPPGTFVEFFDDFNRDNAGTLGPEWSNVEGIITVTSGKAKAG